MKKSYREVLISIANEFQNDYLTPALFGEHNGLNEAQAVQLISLAQQVRASNHPDY